MQITRHRSYNSLFLSLLYPPKEISPLSLDIEAQHKEKWNFFHFAEHHRRKRSEIAAEYVRDEKTKTILRLYGACSAYVRIENASYVKADERILFSEA